ncbi:GreA/GreB family elongation factor [Flammeovirga yaeyamensis]|uniref:Transcription elongation factor GreA n=1 Tax=Flammeovirga yaeyamensis TaxID=367791 RepID=A0AAX1MYL0_9BACT|nr:MULTISPECIES: GreA/GreB family elongation factor [Flammeovirga]ANQ48423.1 transcription elongation factor GreB [Flammeovirga sp. MY04]MBB3696327.1 transcription elongation factor GreB [Flammeovirga yaeyamensis]NMF35006.1 transcription elongation factor GreB [Flammeovirga yaeyamensis]QWG00167.1 GreA/GreB family elongation factor [Flammeovirga yaeyamensis]
MTKSAYITKEGMEGLQQEVQVLWEERKIVTEAVSDAAAMGDRSENAEYIYGKKKLREIDGRLTYLRRRIGNVKVFDQEIDENKAMFSAYVTFKDQTNHMMTLRLVGPDEADIKKQTISIASPIGKALLNKQIGDSVDVVTPAGKKTFTIQKVKY